MSLSISIEAFKSIDKNVILQTNSKVEEDLIKIKDDLHKAQTKIADLEFENSQLKQKYRTLLKKRKHFKFEKCHCFYLIQDPRIDIHSCKFGITSNINIRLKQHRTSWPNLQIRFLVFIEDEEDCKQVETAVRRCYEQHLETLNHEHIKGINIEDIIFQVKSILKVLCIQFKIEENIDKYNEENKQEYTVNNDYLKIENEVYDDNTLNLQSSSNLQDDNVTLKSNSTLMSKIEEDDDTDIKSQKEHFSFNNNRNKYRLYNDVIMNIINENITQDDLTSETIDDFLDEYYTREYYMKGQVGLANFFKYHIVPKRYESSFQCKYRIFCTDANRKILYFRKNGKIVKRVGIECIINLLLGSNLLNTLRNKYEELHEKYISNSKSNLEYYKKFLKSHDEIVALLNGKSRILSKHLIIDMFNDFQDYVDKYSI